MDILPDCRVKHRAVSFSRGIVGTWVPLFCANCGAPGGAVPEEGTTFAFWLCTPCAETYGVIAGTMMMPDEVFYARLAQEQMERYGHYLTQEEWGRIGEDPSHPLWTAIRSKGD